MAFLEFYNAGGCYSLGDLLSNKFVCFHLDNAAVVSAVNSMSASSPQWSPYRKFCSFMPAMAVYVSGVRNVIVDILSHFH